MFVSHIHSHRNDLYWLGRSPFACHEYPHNGRYQGLYKNPVIPPAPNKPLVGGRGTELRRSMTQPELRMTFSGTRNQSLLQSAKVEPVSQRLAFTLMDAEQKAAAAAKKKKYTLEIDDSEKTAGAYAARKDYVWHRRFEKAVPIWENSKDAYRWQWEERFLPGAAARQPKQRKELTLEEAKRLGIKEPWHPHPSLKRNDPFYSPTPKNPLTNPDPFAAVSLGRSPHLHSPACVKTLNTFKTLRDSAGIPAHV